MRLLWPQSHQWSEGKVSTPGHSVWCHFPSDSATLGRGHPPGGDVCGSVPTGLPLVHACPDSVRPAPGCLRFVCSAVATLPARLPFPAGLWARFALCPAVGAACRSRALGRTALSVPRSYVQGADSRLGFHVLPPGKPRRRLGAGSWDSS